MKKFLLSLLTLFFIGGMIFAEQEEDFNVLLERANAGDTQAMVDTGLYYMVFLSDVDNGWAWVKKAQKLDEPSAYHLMGKSYQKGLYIKQNTKKAIKNYEKAVELGFPNSAYELGMIYYAGTLVKKDLPKSVKYLLIAAEKGHAEAQSQIGYLYQNGIGVEKSMDKAFEWHKKAAAQKNVRGMISCATIELQSKYYNPEDAVALLTEVLKNHSEDTLVSYAYGLLGLCYYKGKGIEKNVVLGEEYINKAAELGYTDAKKFLKEE